MSGTEQQLVTARDAFVAQWGAMGSAWGINRTMAQIHALLITSPEPLATNDIMDELTISRGNANTNLRELVNWGLVRSVIRRGERKEFFEAEKDVWRMFCLICRERKRREVDPANETLRQCIEQTKDLESAEAREFVSMLKELQQFVELASSVMERVSAGDESRVMPWALKLLK